MHGDDAHPLWRKLAWMAAIWGGSVLLLFALSGVIRLVLAP